VAATHRRQPGMLATCPAATQQVSFESPCDGLLNGLSMPSLCSGLLYNTRVRTCRCAEVPVDTVAGGAQTGCWRTVEAPSDT
jgi:hypothetical protein